jgi:tetratricopeptide (TPR) repeat protein
VLAADEFIAPREAFSKAKEAALKAIELDESLAEAHASLGFVHHHYDWDWIAADKEFKRALELNPQSAQAWFEEAEVQGQHALEIDPLSALAHLFLGQSSVYAGHFDKAVSQFSKAAELDPNNPWVRWFWGRAYLFNNNPQRALEEMNTLLRLDPEDPLALGFIGYAYATNRPASRRVENSSAPR